MPKFLYTAKSYSGEAKGGELVSTDEKSLAQQLRAEGFLLTSVKQIEEEESGSKVSFMNRFRSVPIKEKMVFARNLSVMVASGLTVSRALSNLGTQTANKGFRKIILDINDEVQGGKTLSDGLAKYPGVFSELFVNMVRVGEAGGSLEDVLQIVATQLEKEHELMSKVKGAMMYPAVIVLAMAGVGVLMLTYILPKITGVFKDMDVELPATTRFIISLSDLLKNHSVAVMVAVPVLGIFLKLFLQTGLGKKMISFLAVHLPVLRNIVIKVNCARFARIHSSLLRSGVSVVDSLRIVSRTLTNYYYKRVLENGIEEVQRGQNLSKIIASNSSIFPPMVYQMLEVGEETGKTETVLAKLAEFYEEEVSQITKNLSSIIEPVLMVVIGTAVGFFAISMLQPMYGLLENIK